MARFSTLAVLAVTLSACCMTDDPLGPNVYAVNRCAFSVSGMPPLDDGTSLNGTYIDEGPTLRDPLVRAVGLLQLECNAEAAGGRRISILLDGFRNHESFQILDSEPSAEWEVRTAGDGASALFQGGSNPESSASIGVEGVASLASAAERSNLTSSFSFSIVDYTVEEGSYVTVEGTTQ